MRAYEEAEMARQRRTPSPQSKRRTVPVRSPSPEACHQTRQQTSSATRPSRSPSPPPSQHTSSTPTYTEAHHTAASIIQRAFRVHSSLRQAALLRAEFAQLKAGFSFPATVDFQSPDGGILSLDSHLSHPVDADASSDTFPKLAYTHANVPLHAYTEALNRLLVRLDGVESFGDRRVRDARKEVVRIVEAEAADVEKWWQGIWEGYRKKPVVDESSAVEDEEMEVDAQLVEADADSSSNMPSSALGRVVEISAHSVDEPMSPSDADTNEQSLSSHPPGPETSEHEFSNQDVQSGSEYEVVNEPLTPSDSVNSVYPAVSGALCSKEGEESTTREIMLEQNSNV
ncbi:hypothetical protein HGRIS_006766 [Hohenbuehelia grisea]